MAKQRTLRIKAALALVALAALLRAAGRVEAADEPAASVGPAPGAPAITAVEVPGDADVLVVPGAKGTRRPIVNLHGMCADPKDDLAAWGAVAAAHGPVVALVGDAPCPEKPGRTKWSPDVGALDARIRSAVSAVGGAVTGPLVLEQAVVIGESMGAARTELLAARYPERYARAVLVGAPQVPSPQSFRSARAIATVAGEREDTSKMRAGARALSAAGIRARYWTLPGATHGSYGSDGPRVMAEAIAFVTAP